MSQVGKQGATARRGAITIAMMATPVGFGEARLVAALEAK